VSVVHFGTWPSSYITLIYYFTNLYLVYSPLEGDGLPCLAYVSAVRTVFKASGS
jgi:hypothetical protein